MNNKVLIHHGIKGMKWGVRRYQNPDGSLTAAGRARYGYSDSAKSKNLYERSKDNVEEMYPHHGGEKVIRRVKEIDDAGSYLSDKSIKAAESFERYCDAVGNSIHKYGNDRQLKNDLFKHLNKEFSNPSEVDDEEYLKLVINEYLYDELMPKVQSDCNQEYKDYRSKVETYYKDLDDIASEIVGQYGDEPISYRQKTEEIGKTKILKRPVYKTTEVAETYKQVVDNTLEHLSNASYVHYLLNHEEASYLDGDGAYEMEQLANKLIKEWYNS